MVCVNAKGYETNGGEKSELLLLLLDERPDDRGVWHVWVHSDTE